jgi:hypothetical protein
MLNILVVIFYKPLCLVLVLVCLIIRGRDEEEQRRTTHALRSTSSSSHHALPPMQPATMIHDGAGGTAVQVQGGVLDMQANLTTEDGNIWS